MGTYKLVGRNHGPVVEVSVAGPKGNAVSVSGLLDTGADLTCFPIEHLKALRLGLDYDVATVGGTTGEGNCRIYTLNMSINRCSFEEVDVIASSFPYALVGRNILNGFRVTFDGPGRAWMVSGNADC